ncbi:MAG: 50S ribosomal protein L25 [Minisyncoccia bacterium]|jgi:large subunit ribosomal protein L25
MDLAVQKREKFGRQTKALRAEGLIPAELYGHGLANIHLSVPVKDFTKVFKEAGMNTVVTLLVEKDKRPALIYEVMHDAITGEVAHVDFYQVRMDEKIKAKVPLEFTGEAPAVKEKGAILNKSMSEVEVEALPQDLPHKLLVDLAALDDVNKSIYVRDLVVPKGVEVLIEENTAVATATPPAPKEEEKVVEEPVVDVSAVKVEGEEKKAERAAEKVEKTGKTEKAEGRAEKADTK